MADMPAIREGLATNLRTITGAQVSAYMTTNPTTPALQVTGPDEIEYDLSMQRGLDRLVMVVQGLVGSPTDIGRQVVLDRWLAPSGDLSVKAAIEADYTLGGIVAGARVARVSGYRVYQMPNKGATLGAEWFVEIHNPGS